MTNSVARITRRIIGPTFPERNVMTASLRQTLGITKGIDGTHRARDWSRNTYCGFAASRRGPKVGVTVRATIARVPGAIAPGQSISTRFPEHLVGAAIAKEGIVAVSARDRVVTIP